ncbi:hypothetical protein [Chroococcidiopsis sp. CCNUC1]|uniref:hypothetical protein n=1 Tax=Chroococcidiopsis sp. CCNUC1 TaxID=2653189 RepID=UPI0020200E48|nr:hypothetical protein [Chroococcidiopsis sp. CCNUC1]URD51783.1 hypothetical protein M5J74_07265 [Chroococcidiopsis sp. CCNUC1]
MEYNYPIWLYHELIDDILPWQQGQKIAFKQFNAKYTLHDSYWVGIFYDVAYQQSVTLAIQWDAVWLPKEMKENNSVVNEPYLFIRLTDVEQVSTANYTNLNSICRAIAGCEFEEVEGKKFLAIDDVYGGQVNVLYQGEETFLALEKDRSILSL